MSRPAIPDDWRPPVRVVIEQAWANHPGAISSTGSRPSAPRAAYVYGSSSSPQWRASAIVSAALRYAQESFSNA
jgi:hypothetical protein